MTRLSKFLGAVLILFVLIRFATGLTAAPAPDGVSSQLRPATLAAYTRYVQATDARIKKEIARPGAFLSIDGLPDSRAAAVRPELKEGDIYMNRLATADGSGGSIAVPGGLIHHWVGAVFVPGATLKQALEMAQDYAHHQNIYQPEIVRSRLLSHAGNEFKIFYRLRKHKIITVTLNSEHDVRYFPIDAKHAYSRSSSTRITEIENADQPNERAKPAGQDSGFLWHIDSWWRWEERDGGVYTECESVSLTRDIPTGLGWLIKPFVTSIPKESLESSLGSTRSALLERVAKARRP